MSSTTSTHFEAIVVGAGVVGPAIATGLARQGRSVLLVERDWKTPDRIVGELLQPAGVKALRALGMVQAVNNIDAIPVRGYTVFSKGDRVAIPYPHKADSAPVPAVKSCVFGSNDKIIDDSTLSSDEFENGEYEMGVAFEHGRFISNLRSIATQEKNVTALEGTVTELIKNETGVHGVFVKEKINGSDKTVTKSYTADLTVMCDGIFSKFRRELADDNVPTVKSHFIALKLHNADIPAPNTGHVILGNDFAPVLVYQTTPEDTRVLCAYDDAKLPRDPKKYLRENVLPNIPKSLQPSFEKSLEGPIKSMPNSWLPAKPNDIPGLFVIGDALNMRHPLTGGGMSVGLNDALLLIRLLEHIPSLSDRETVTEHMIDFHYERKNLDAVVNILSIALFSLFAASSPNLRVLQRGCFRYFQLGGSCVSVPVGFLSGTKPNPFLLAWVFFKVALYGVWCNFRDNGLLLLPLSIVQMFMVLATAAYVFAPYLLTELFQ
ncbi:CYFA0S05e01024g1_1 [Cyberlindnera fabianii]|uniref:Squalene monooxygenase n=1 Tax=Cyberlindnera fabianii TaxID=36022 RepID=A0A061ASG8_CYBFA|nr:Squalene monooxygenase [Cyberlindnera fabianii]CDR40481.1 CYFA0S05e01024g1_1 [Cyberlindnera fabianii]